MKPISLYWWEHDDPRVTNVGDALSPLIVRAVSGRQVVHAPIERCDLIAIGSILEIAIHAERRAPLAVWGSGFIADGPRSPQTRLQYAAVRGPLSASRVAGAKTVGDPALLVTYLYAPAASTATPIGFVPHYRDLDHPVVVALRSAGGPCRIISSLLPPLEFLAAVSTCELVLSSSLHGLVVADAYGVPNAWIELGDGIIGAGYKYRDHLGAFGLGDVTPIRIAKPDDVNASLVEAVSTSYDRPGLATVQAGLLAAFPGGI